ncbi:hypothetical protein IGI04_042344 [Brassica rapa subsp. trilocularis]|uniref:Uncharacterized protein n=1 Tax=Brassica rapa subsp. trilocularis TaxID=1813537 RepID=A0ABQ7KLD8_BRACM|nr:hypothetical protein IGI04_042344 [Brassica rapa subsp. trilocularis]
MASLSCLLLARVIGPSDMARAPPLAGSSMLPLSSLFDWSMIISRALTSQEVITKADFEAFIRALKESGKMLGNTLGYSYSAHTLLSISDKLSS